jgi:outer membrane lipoprotein-sorting protein
MKKYFLGAGLFGFMSLMSLFSQTEAAGTPQAAALLAKIDNNEIYDSIQYEGEMVINYQGRRYVKTMKAWARGKEFSFIEFTNSDDAGTKYLKREGRLYVYSPDTEEVMLISGHMLKESMMGSDMSYEDTIDNNTLSARYTPSIAGSDVWKGPDGNRDCWLLELTAKKKTESYPRQKLWVDKATGDMLHCEQYALSGAKLKEYSLLKIETQAGKRFPVEMEIRDMLRKNSGTVMRMKNVILDKPIPETVFSMRNLER